MKRVLVTGASGFIGRQTLDELVARGFEVHAVCSRDGRQVVRPEVQWHVADLLDKSQAVELVARVQPSHLLHLAWYAEPGKFWNAAENLDWVGASLELFRAFVIEGGTRAVCAGTCAEYAWSNKTKCDERTTQLRPLTLYGASKNALRSILEPFARDSGVSLAWGRVFFLYGPHEDERRLISSVASKLLAGEVAETSHGKQVRDFLHVADAGAAFAALLDSSSIGPVNIASGEPVSIRSLVEEVATAAERRDLLALGARQSAPHDPARLTANATRIRAEVGWTPQFGIVDGIADTVNWWRSELKLGADLSDG